MARDISRETSGAREGVGVDLGLVWLTTLSFGWWFFGNPRPLECYLDRLKVLQRALSRKRFLSGNWFTSKRRLAKHHEYVRDFRCDLFFKLGILLVL